LACPFRRRPPPPPPPPPPQTLSRFLALGGLAQPAHLALQAQKGSFGSGAPAQRPAPVGAAASPAGIFGGDAPALPAPRIKPAAVAVEGHSDASPPWSSVYFGSHGLPRIGGTGFSGGGGGVRGGGGGCGGGGGAAVRAGAGGPPPQKRAKVARADDACGGGGGGGGRECSLCCDLPVNCVLTCGHPFRRPCVDAWVAKSRAAHGGVDARVPCPTCRAPLERVTPLFL